MPNQKYQRRSLKWMKEKVNWKIPGRYLKRHKESNWISGQRKGVDTEVKDRPNRQMSMNSLLNQMKVKAMRRRKNWACDACLCKRTPTKVVVSPGKGKTLNTILAYLPCKRNTPIRNWQLEGQYRVQLNQVLKDRSRWDRMYQFYQTPN